jgi:hypothetical protein
VSSDRRRAMLVLVPWIVWVMTSTARWPQSCMALTLPNRAAGGNRELGMGPDGRRFSVPEPYLPSILNACRLLPAFDECSTHTIHIASR